MKQAYRDKVFRSDAAERIETCDAIITEYQAQGFRLTLRQLYYQLVARDLLPNTEKSYKNLSTLVSDARLAGLLDWDAIEDRGRQPHTPSDFEDLNELVTAALASYRLPRWRGQEVYAELWVEKDALAGVLAPLSRKHHVTLMVNKGYSSQSAMYESAQRFIDKQGGHGDDGDIRGPPLKGLLFYLGDLDPSGEDMVRDIQERLAMFGARVSVQKVALTMAQVKKYKPPPNPAKVTDPRAKAYIEKYGNSSWEVDALPPPVLSKLINDALENVIDKGMLARVLKQERQDVESLRSAVKAAL